MQYMATDRHRERLLQKMPFELPLLLLPVCFGIIVRSRWKALSGPSRMGDTIQSSGCHIADEAVLCLYPHLLFSRQYYIYVVYHQTNEKGN